MLLTCMWGFVGCTDKELEAFDGELYFEIQKVKNGAKGIITIVHDDSVLETVEFMYNQFNRYKIRNAPDTGAAIINKG